MGIYMYKSNIYLIHIGCNEIIIGEIALLPVDIIMHLLIRPNFLNVVAFQELMNLSHIQLLTAKKQKKKMQQCSRTALKVSATVNDTENKSYSKTAFGQRVCVRTIKLVHISHN